MSESTAINEHCWVCQSSNIKLWKTSSLDRPLQPEDLQITDKRYGLTLTLYQCQDCRFLFADQQGVTNLVKLYEQLDDQGYLETSESRNRQMQWLIDTAKQAQPAAKTLLDIGAGLGLLVAEANRQGLTGIGVEPSKSLVEIGRQKLNVTLHQGIFPHPELANQTFDLITLVDVIEHVPDPVGLLHDISKALAPGGKAIVVTPDVGSKAARWLGKRWWHFRLAHIGYFDDQTLTLAAEKAGLKVDRYIRAKWFFPVDYLADRLSSYLPISWWNKIARNTPGLRWLYQRVVTVNLFDSWVVILQKGSKAETNE
jgi:2-polyprenyl-3-methyl-5-hydroxy-6-metoxy-1,4-benzoquinol methylase